MTRMLAFYSFLLIVIYVTAQTVEITTSTSTSTTKNSEISFEKVADGVNNAWNDFKTGIKTAVDTASGAIQNIGKPDEQSDIQIGDATRQNEDYMRSTLGMVEAHTAAPANSTEKGFFKRVFDGIKNLFSKNE